MATGAIVSGIIGGAMAAGGVGAAVRAARLKAQPRKVYFGGSADGYNELTAGYGDEVDAAGVRTDRGVSGLNLASLAGNRMNATGEDIMRRGDTVNPVRSSAMSLLDSYKPGEASRAAATAAADKVANATLATAGAGGALGMRDALYANTSLGQGVARDAAEMRAQEEQALLTAKVDQANAERAAVQDAQKLRLQTLGLGSQIAQGGNSQVIGSSQGITQAGLAGQNLYQDALQSAQDRQFSADMDYEQRRQAERQRRSDRIWGLAGSMISGGAAIAANGAGGGKGGGGWFQSGSASTGAPRPAGNGNGDQVFWG